MSMALASFYAVSGTYLPGVEIFLVVFTLFLLFTRLYSRWVILKSFGWDDVFICIAYVFALLVTVAQLLGIHYGWGHHEITLALDLPRASQVLICEWIQTWAFFICALFTKLSILGFYLRFARADDQRTFRILIFIAMGFVTLWSLGVFVITIVGCRPVDAWWLFDVPANACLTTHQVTIASYSQAGLNIFSDFVVFALPLPTVWRVRVSVIQKLLMVGLMCLGLLVCVIAVVRLVVMVRWINGSDRTYYGYEVYLWFILEAYFAIICACLPFSRPLFNIVMPSIFKRIRNLRCVTSSKLHGFSGSSPNQSGGSHDAERGEGQNDRHVKRPKVVPSPYQDVSLATYEQPERRGSMIIGYLPAFIRRGSVTEALPGHLGSEAVLQARHDL